MLVAEHDTVIGEERPLDAGVPAPVVRAGRVRGAPALTGVVVVGAVEQRELQAQRLGPAVHPVLAARPAEGGDRESGLGDARARLQDQPRTSRRLLDVEVASQQRATGALFETVV